MVDEDLKRQVCETKTSLWCKQRSRDRGRRRRGEEAIEEEEKKEMKKKRRKRNRR